MTWLSRTFEDWNDDVSLFVVMLVSIGLALAAGLLASVPVYLFSDVLLSGSRWEYGVKIGGAVASTMVIGPRFLRIAFPALIDHYNEKQSDRATRRDLGARN